jgi:hypothetical protein
MIFLEKRCKRKQSIKNHQLRDLSLFMAGDGSSSSNKTILPNPKYQLKNIYPLLAKNVTKGYHSVVMYTYP